MSAAPETTPLGRLLAARIRERGPLTFAEYMEECLYHPEFGYYSHAGARRMADFYTSVDVHPIFGRLLARQFAEMWEGLGRPQPFLLVEAGAGEGRLAAHVLDFASQKLAGFYRALQYVAVERSAALREAHEAHLADHRASGRAVTAGELPQRISAGCIFSNELLDAMPVHRVERADGGLRELYVGLEEGRLCGQAGPLSSPTLEEYLSAQRVELQPGQQAEIGLAAARWMEDAGRRLGRGFLLTVDYGHPARELYNERHVRGTLLAYHKHRADEDYFRAPGEQDLTAHVNFSALELWGARAGLQRTGLVAQANFLLALGRGNELADLYDEGQGGTERVRARLQFKTLIHPEGMGETFQVLVQHRGVERPRLTGLQPL